MSKSTIICFGEVLWDMLPSGKKPGGAPMNVAFHTNNLGSQVKMISRVGQDQLGNELLDFLKNQGFSTDLIQQDKNLPTSTVAVHLDKFGTPSYEIINNVAWDNIQITDDFLNEIPNIDAVIFGSLASRNEVTCNSLCKILEYATLRIFDVNLRPPFYSKALLERLLKDTDILKVNEEELEIITSWYAEFTTDFERLQFVKETYNIDIIVLTKGKEGAICFDDNQLITQPIYPIEVKDTVGSGDAFLAGFVHEFLQGKSTSKCLKLAAAMGAIVSTKNGATPVVTMKELETLLYQ